MTRILEQPASDSLSTGGPDGGGPRPRRKPASAPSSRGTRRRSRTLTWLSRLLLTAGLAVVLYGVYELFVTDLIAENERAEIMAEWRAAQETTDQEPAGSRIGTEHRDDFPIIEGQGMLGLLHVPRWDGIGDIEKYTVPIGSGTGNDVLDSGQLGHYPHTQPIGARGNAGLSGHRTTHGKPLREVHHLQDGDALVVESKDAWLVYRVVARDIVKPHQTEVLDPVPTFEGAARGRYITLTTCDPIFGISDRYIVWAVGDYWTPKGEGPPPALTENLDSDVLE